jgi:hypothetical protein
MVSGTRCCIDVIIEPSENYGFKRKRGKLVKMAEEKKY